MAATTKVSTLYFIVIRRRTSPITAGLKQIVRHNFAGETPLFAKSSQLFKKIEHRKEDIVFEY